VGDLGELTIERFGGFGGFGLPGSRIRSHGTVSSGQLSTKDRETVENLFRTKGQAGSAPPVADGFRYRITRQGPNGPETVEVPEASVPDALRSSVKDELQ
jgi:hypothetical protein